MVSFRNCEVQLRNVSVDVVKDLCSWSCVSKYAFIEHTQAVEPNISSNHYHIMLAFNNPVPIDNVAKHFNVETNFIEKCKSWKSAVAYLTHENVDKPKYPRESIVSNYDFNDDIEAGIDASRKLGKLDLSPIFSGDCRRFNYSKYFDGPTYCAHKREIENAFEYYENTLSLKGANRSMEVCYICGASGCGKTTYAKFVAESNNMSYCISSSANDPLQDYKGQDVLILDDFRPWDWKLSDFLKLTDNNTISSAKSRFSNKYMYFCKMILITSTIPFYECWDKIGETDGEEIKQLYRRIGTRINIIGRGDKTRLEIDCADGTHCFIEPPKEYIAIINPQVGKSAFLNYVKGTVTTNETHDFEFCGGDSIPFEDTMLPFV